MKALQTTTAPKTLRLPLQITVDLPEQPLANLEPGQEVHVREMRDGDVAIITGWTSPEHIGRVLVRCDDIAVAVGVVGCPPYRSLWDTSYPPNPHCKVRILPAGYKLEV